MSSSAKNLFLILAGIMSLSGCSSPDNTARAQSKPQVVASHNVICDLVDTVARDTIDLTCLIDADQDPHTYRPSPTQRKTMEEAQSIIYGGYQLEPKITKLLEAINEQIPKIALYEVVTEPIMVEHSHGHSHEEHSHEEHSHEEHSHEEHSHEEHSHEEHSHEEHSHEETATDSTHELAPDPHVWHNVENTVAMVEYLTEILLQTNSAEAELYLKNSTALVEQLWQLDGWIDEQIATVPEGQRILFTTHDSLNYYVDAYSLEDDRALQGVGAEASPSASQVRYLVAEIEQTGVPTIFAESTKSDRVIKNVAREANVELASEELYVDGLGEADSYIEMMSHNTCAIVNGLGGECQPFVAGN